jgi:hypothetical protein
MDNITVKKKRGRKPKDNTIINENPIFADDKDGIDDLIIKLNYDNTDNEVICTINEIDNFSTQICKKNKSEICWNCCHQIDDLIGLPIKYHDKRFYTVGDFCSLECACRYAYENYNNIHEILSITNLYNNIVLNRTDKINMAPNKLVLEKFGGNISIEDYRKNTNNIYNVNLPIIIHMNNNISKYEHKNNDNKSYKLYRKKDINKKNDIFKYTNSVK